MALIKTISGMTPQIHPAAFVAETAVLTADVEIHSNAGVWYGAVLRGDVGKIVIGEESNIQDGVVIHCTTDRSRTIVGRGVTVGHRAVLHGCILEDGCLIGMGAIVMDNARVGRFAIVAPGAVVLENQQLESGFLYGGVPAKKIKPLSPAQIEGLKDNAAHYVEMNHLYK